MPVRLRGGSPSIQSRPYLARTCEFQAAETEYELDRSMNLLAAGTLLITIDTSWVCDVDFTYICHSR